MRKMNACVNTFPTKRWRYGALVWMCGCFLFLFAFGTAFSEAASCKKRCTEAVKCTFAGKVNGEEKGGLYENDCTRKLNTKTDDGTSTSGSKNNRTKSAGVVKICNKSGTTDGIAETSCVSDQGAQWQDSACADECETPV